MVKNLKKQQQKVKDASETTSVTLDEKTLELTKKVNGKELKQKVLIRSAMRKSDGSKYLYLQNGRRNFFIDSQFLEEILGEINDLNWEEDDIEPVSNETIIKESDDKVLSAIEKLTAHISQLGKNQSAITKRLKKLEK